MEKWESDFVAQLCLDHLGGKIEIKNLPFGRDQVKTRAYLKLLAILRVSDALDRGHKSQAKLKGARVDRKSVNLLLSGRTGVDLEILRVEQKKALFESVFKKQLAVKRV